MTFAKISKIQDETEQIQKTYELFDENSRLNHSPAARVEFLTNTRYIDWVTDLAPSEFHRTHPMKGLRIDYRHETFPEEEITLDWELTDRRLWCASVGRFAAEITF